jgi:glycopeptide antibiotics resistance protein
MVTVGGPEVMLLGALAAGVACALLGLGLARLGVGRPWAVAGLLWSVVVIGLVTLLPTNGSPGWIPAEEAQDACSWDYGGPAPEGFWIFGGGQRLLNTLLFVPSGMFLAVATLRRGTWWLAVPGLAALAAYSMVIERVQLELTRLDRACDVTDVVDNVTGAALGFGLGIVVATALGLGSRRTTR